MTTVADENCYECGAPIVCWICDACAAHCHTDGGPDACWEAHESAQRMARLSAWPMIIRSSRHASIRGPTSDAGASGGSSGSR
jgi:hypothetical protein